MTNIVALDIRQKFFHFINPKSLDPSYKMDLDFWGCDGREKPIF